MTLSKILGTLFVPVIALTVFANQLYRQSAYDLSAWKGGGMGRFALVPRQIGRRAPSGVLCE
jgi:hypothetical protein